MTQEINKVQAAQEAAALAAQAAQNAADGAEAEWLSKITHVKQLSEGKTQIDASRAKSKYISLFGFDRWQRLVANGR